MYIKVQEQHSVNWVSVSEPQFIVLTCKPHTIRAGTMSISDAIL